MREFGETLDVAVTILVDNRADLIPESTETVKRVTDEPLLAEHGFSAVVHLRQEGVRILWDAGTTPVALMENVRRMKLDLHSIDAIALSHGHLDHVGALPDVLREMNPRLEAREWKRGAQSQEMADYARGRHVPLVAHPAAFRERWHVAKDGSMTGPSPVPPRAEWEALGAEVTTSEGPHRFASGCWTTGYVPRESFESSGRSSSVVYRQGDRFLPDDMEDDQAIVINVEDKGLVVISGCAHSGILNTVNQARSISGVERVWAVLGGLHLGRASDDEIQRTVDGIKDLEPTVVVPTHCTGFGAMCAVSEQMPSQFVQGLVGTTYLF